MTSSVAYKGALRTGCTHLQSGSFIETDAPADNHGKGERFSPTDMMATSLAACMVTVMGIKAQSMGVVLEGITVNVEKIMKPDPRRVGGINLFFSIPESLRQIEEKTKKILKYTAETCPVQQSIHPDIDVQLHWGDWA